MNILLVDDDPIFNFLNKKTLEQVGIVTQIDTALNGHEAIKLLNDYFSGLRALPDIILLDLNMPIMDGFAFLEAFRHLSLPGKENIKIIIVSSSDNPDDMRRAKLMGIDHYLSKPVSPEMLRSLLL